MLEDAFSGPHLFGAIDPQAVSAMAWMSDLAYTAQGRPLAELLAERGWQPLGTGDLDLPAASFDRLGCYDQHDGQGFVAVRGGALAVVFRGSDEPSDLANSAFDQQEVGQDVRPMVHQALAWVEVHPEIGTVYITGHSLGGALAGNFASSIDEFPPLSRPVQFQVVAFGSPGSEQDDRNDLTHSMLEVNHTGDPVPTDDLLGSWLEHHGSVAAIDLPLVPDASSLVELGMQKLAQQDDPALLTEHDSEIYRESTAVIAASPLYAYTTRDMSTAILGSSTDDSYSVAGAGAFTLGGGGNDTIYGSAGSDLLDGGAGDDLLFGEPGEALLASVSGEPMLSGGGDALAGGIGSDVLFGGGGRDFFVFAPAVGGGTDRIGGFTPGIDHLDVRAFSFADFEAQVAPLLAPGAEGAVVSLSAADGEDVILAGLDAASLGPADFLL